MKNKLTKKILASLILTVFVFSNACALADNKPVLRTDSNDPIKLKADVSITEATEPVTLSLRDSDVKQVLRMFADKAGMNIMFDEGVSGNVTLDLVNMPLNTAFEMILNMTKLNYYVTNNTLIIARAGADINLATQEIFTVPVKYMNASAMANFLNTNVFAKQKPGLSGTSVVSTNPMTNELIIMGNENDAKIAQKMIDKFDKKPISTQVKVSHTTPAQMADMICNMLIPTAAQGKSDSKLAKLKGFITGAASELSVELGGGTVACSVNSNGIIPFKSLTISYFPQIGTIGIMGGSSEQQEMVKEFIADNDKKQPQAYLEVSIVELNESGSKELTNTWQYISQNFTFNASNGISNMNPNMPFFIGGGDKYPVYKSDDPTTPAYWMKKYTGPSSLVYAVNYLVENKKGRVVANPRILITNGQESTIDLTSDYVKKQTSQFIDSVLSGAAQRTYEIGSDNGIKINVTPFISPDGYVTLNITPDYATIASQITTPSSGGPSYPDDIQVTLLQRRNLALKNVRIKDGETLIIGGMISESDTKTVKKIPFLGDLPGIGMFFRSSATSRMKEEMIIMITPKIITDDEDIATTL